jgi:dolichyl-phosphate-mannose-protein mannosyltransferase
VIPARRAMCAVAGLFLVKAVVLALWVTPLWDVPDETGHYAIIADLADGKGLPLPGRSVLPADVVADWTKGRTLTTEERWNWVAQHPPLYHLLAVPFLAAARAMTPEPRWRYRAPRLFTAISGAATLLVLFAVFAEASGDAVFALAAASSFAFLPTFSHMSSGTNHDVFLAFLCAAAAFYWVRLSKSGRFSDGLKMSALLAAAAATKLSALVVAAALLLFSWKALASRGWRRAIEWLAMAGLAVSLAALWAVRHVLLLGNARFHPISKEPFSIASFLSYLRNDPVVDHTFKNFVGLIGWTASGAGRVDWFQISGVFLAVWLFVALAAAAASAVRLWKSDRSPWRNAGRTAALLVFFFGVLWLFSGADGSAPVKRLLYSLLISVPLLALPRIFSRGTPQGELLPAVSCAVFLVFAAAYLVNSWEAYAIYGSMRATNGRYFFAVLPWIGLAFGLPAAGLLARVRRREALLLAVPAALFVNETLFFLLRVIPFSRRVS